SEEDKELQNELKLLVDKVVGKDQTLIPAALEMLKYLTRTSTTSMTSVPKPLKYLAPFYDILKQTHKKMSEDATKKSLADVISILAMGTAGGEEAKINCDCLKYCLQGTMKNIGDWGHEYIRQLEKEIAQLWPYDSCEISKKMLIPLVNDIIYFNCHHHAEIQACDLLMEIDMLHMLPEYMAKNTYQRMCMYLSSCSKYVDEMERSKIMKLTCEQYLKFHEYSRSLITAIQMNDNDMVNRIFLSCKDKTMLYQLAFICARHLYPVDIDDISEEFEAVNNILSNSHLSSYFLTLARDLTFLEPKSPEDVYKAWLEPLPPRITVLGEHMDSARQNLASSFVNGFVNAGFGCDKLLTAEGTSPESLSESLLGTHREDVIDLLLPIILTSNNPEIIGLASLAAGMISLGKYDNSVSNTILNRIIELNHTEVDHLKTPYMRLASLGMALCYFGARDAIEAPTEATNVLEEPFKTAIQTVLLMCAYAGTGDVLIIQELLHVVGEKVEIPKKEKKQEKKEKARDSFTRIKLPKKVEWDYSMGQAMATLAVAVVSMGEDIGVEMTHRIFGHVGRYGDPSVRKVVPLTIALSSVSNPQLSAIDILTKYSHDADDDVACNAIFGLGLIGAGSNNARLAACLRQLAVYHTRNPFQLFMVRIAQGLVHMGKGTLTLDPLHTDRQLVDPVALTGLLATAITLMEPYTLILNRSHYLLYMLVTAMQPRWLLTLDENLEPLPITVRVGQAVDIVGSGHAKNHSRIHTHTTPVLLATAERAELATDEYDILAPTLDGICVLRKVPDAKK
ncbi:hypothetical protein NQ317_000288, partial [Molorchus minor]